MERPKQIIDVTERNQNVQMHELRHSSYLPAINALYEGEILGQYTFNLGKETGFIGDILLMPNKEVSLNEL